MLLKVFLSLPPLLQIKQRPASCWGSYGRGAPCNMQRHASKHGSEDCLPGSLMNDMVALKDPDTVSYRCVSGMESWNGWLVCVCVCGVGGAV